MASCPCRCSQFWAKVCYAVSKCVTSGKTKWILYVGYQVWKYFVLSSNRGLVRGYLNFNSRIIYAIRGYFSSKTMLIYMLFGDNVCIMGILRAKDNAIYAFRDNSRLSIGIIRVYL